MAIVEQGGETPARPGAGACGGRRQRKGRHRKIDPCDPCRGRAAQGRAAGRHHRSRFAPAELYAHFERRRIWASSIGRALELPRHHCVALGDSVRLDENETSEFTDFTTAVEAVEDCCDFVVIDTPGADTYPRPPRPRHGRHAGHAAQRQHGRSRHARRLSTR